MVELIEAGVDWLTLTASNETVAAQLSALWPSIVSRETDNGGIPTERPLLGYTGVMVNGQFYGSRADGWMLRVTGESANHWAKQLVATAAKVTRIDVQVTVRTEHYRADLGRVERAQAKVNRAALPGRNWAKMPMHDGDGEGDTVFVGSRTSARYGRIYDKQKESGDDRYERCWRYEVEYKDELAPLAATELRAVDDIARFAIGLCRSQFTDWGFDWPYPNGVDVVAPRAGGVKSDTQRTLDWLLIQVRPSIGKLLDAGLDRDVILESLGLDWPALQDN